MNSDDIFKFIRNTRAASALTLFFASIFGKKIVCQDEYCTVIILREWRGKTYFEDFIPDTKEF